MQNHPKFVCSQKDSKATLDKKNNAGGMTISYFKLCYRASITLAQEQIWKNEWNKIEDPYMSMCNLYLTSGAGKTEYQHVEGWN